MIIEKLIKKYGVLRISYDPVDNALYHYPKDDPNERFLIYREDGLGEIRLDDLGFWEDSNIEFTLEDFITECLDILHFDFELV